MPDTADQVRYQQFAELTDRLLEELPREIIAEATRILAMNVAHYRAKYGELPVTNPAHMMSGDDSRFDDESTKLLADGMETLAGVLALAMDLEDGFDGHVH